MMTRIAAVCLALSGTLLAGELKFDGNRQEVHAPAAATSIKASFRFKNESDRTVAIRKHEAGCSCMSVKLEGDRMKYAPGESGVLEATFDMANFTGSIDKTILVWIDDDAEEKPSIRLDVRVHIQTLIALEPKTLKWNSGGKAERQKIDIRMQGDLPIHVLNVDTASQDFTTELKTIEVGKHYELWIAPVSTEKTSLAVIRMETDCEVARQKVQQVFAVVRKL